MTEIGGDRVQELTTSGTFVTKFGLVGSGPEQFAEPMGVVIGSTGDIYVTDYEHPRYKSGRDPPGG